MKINIKNYWENYPRVKNIIEKDETLKATHNILKKFKDKEGDAGVAYLYDKKTDLFDLFFIELNKQIKDGTSVKKPQRKTSTTRKKATKSRTTVKSPQKKTTTRKVKQVEYRVPYVKNPEDGAVKSIESFLRLAKKGKVEYKRVVLFLKRLQNAILNQQIRKNSPYAQLILWIQDYMLKKANQELNDTDLVTISLGQQQKLFQEFARKQAYTSARLLIRYVRMQGTRIDVTKATTLLNAMKKGLVNGSIPAHDPNRKQVQNAVKYLTKHIKSQGKIEFTQQQLTGLGSIPHIVLRGAVAGATAHLASAGMDKVFAKPKSGVMTSSELSGIEFETLGMVGETAEFLGDPSPNFRMLIHGKQGQGKSTYALMFAHELAKDYNKKTLYYSAEEGFSLTMQTKINQYGLKHHNLLISNQISDKLIRSVDVIVIDSINTSGLTIDKFRKLDQKYPSKAFVLISQSTKDGTFRGSQEWGHEVDIVIKVENGKAITKKNRFNPLTEFKIF